MSTKWLHGGYRYLQISVWRLYGAMNNFGGYLIGIAQIDDEIKEN